MISTRNLSDLPDIEGLRRLAQSLALLDAIIQPDWEYRYYSFNRNWSPGEQMASMRNGQGDEWYCLFTDTWAAQKGFDHESQMSPWSNKTHAVWPGVLDQVPQLFASFLNEPSFSMKDTTFCIWRTIEDDRWRIGDISFPSDNDPDGSEYLLELLDGRPETYQDFGQRYYERALDLQTITAIYKFEPLTIELARKLNPEFSIDNFRKELDEIGYPAKL